MSDTYTVVDAFQHCTATKETKTKTVAMDCPYTGKGEEFSPTHLVDAALSGCMLLSMGAFATRQNIDLTEARVDVDITSVDKPLMRLEFIDIGDDASRDFGSRSGRTRPSGRRLPHQALLRRRYRAQRSLRLPRLTQR